MDNHKSQATTNAGNSFIEAPSAAGASTVDPTPGGSSQSRQPSKALSAFLRTQQDNLLELRAALVDSVTGITRETRADGINRADLTRDSGDAANNTCDHDLALSLVSEGTNVLLEIDQALARIAGGTYGICEISGRQIPRPRLKVIPFARFTAECQSQIEKEKKRLIPARPFESPFSVARKEESDQDDGNDEHDDA